MIFLRQIFGLSKEMFSLSYQEHTRELLNNNILYLFFNLFRCSREGNFVAIYIYTYFRLQLFLTNKFDFW